MGSQTPRITVTDAEKALAGTSINLTADDNAPFVRFPEFLLSKDQVEKRQTSRISASYSAEHFQALVGSAVELRVFFRIV